MGRLHEAFSLVKINLTQAREQQKSNRIKDLKQQNLMLEIKSCQICELQSSGLVKTDSSFCGLYPILKVSYKSTVEIQQYSGKQMKQWVIFVIQK